MKSVEFNPVGVCSKKMIVECDDNEIITKVQIIGGCPGNTLGVSKLCLGKSVDEVISLLEGVRCGARSSSCPDQLAKALKKLKETD
ncbi:MAG: TIGR03905 family TSCPD domain-containing protein [Firmicutes bacterium]|nr:TIGR03905 family TSCPD domain-containing protein [Bacillota bacterium]